MSSLGYPWKGRAPVSVVVGDQTTGDWAPFVAAAIAAWNVSSVVDLSVGPKGALSVVNGRYGLGSTHVAWTDIRTRNHFMVQATIRLNDDYTYGYVNPDGVPFPAQTPDQRAHLVAHELGHALGLVFVQWIAEIDGGGGWLTGPTADNLSQLADLYHGGA